jgi:hypothetical protein
MAIKIQTEDSDKYPTAFLDMAHPDTAGRIVRPRRIVRELTTAVFEYMARNNIKICDWVTRSCDNPLEDNLEAFLLQRDLIRNIDGVYVAGCHGIIGKNDGFQVGIGPFNGKNIWHDKTWFIWNANGYDRNTKNSGYLQLGTNRPYFFRE